MSPIMLAKKILDMSESDLVQVLMQLEMEDRNLYNDLQEKIEDVL